MHGYIQTRNPSVLATIFLMHALMLSVIFKTKTSAIFSVPTKDTGSLGAVWFMGSEFRMKNCDFYALFGRATRVEFLVKPAGAQPSFHREAIL